MAMMKEWNNPGGKKDKNYKLDVMTIAPLMEIPKIKSSKFLKTTGKEEQGKETIITYENLEQGMTIPVEDGKRKTEKTH